MERGNEQRPNPYRTDGQSGVTPGYGFNPGHHTVPMTTMQPMQGGPIMGATRGVMMSQPDEDGPAPNTTRALVMSTLIAIFCFISCGFAAVLMAWQARLQVLDRKFRHARHSLSIVWVFVGTAIFFGLVCWVLIIWTIATMFINISRLN